MPLGALSRKQIESAYDILSEIEEVLQASDFTCPLAPPSHFTSPIPPPNCSL